jgi:hypothetical protein
MYFKNIIGTFAVLLTFISYIPYTRDIIKGKTKPHIYSWFLWGFVTLIAFALQLSDNAGPGAFVTLTAALLCSVVIILSFVKKGNSEIVLLDTLFLILAFIALALWLVAKQPLLSIILVTVVDLLGFLPTVRKSWNKPYSETLSFYWANTFRFLLATIALTRYTVITALYPISWMAINGLFALMLIWRRKKYEYQKI